MRNLDYDAVVVGASTAGLHAAALLAREGMRVAVLERKGEPALPARSWIVTQHIAAVLGAWPGEAVVHRTGVMELFAGRAFRAVRLNPADLVVERSLLIRLLRRRAEKAGAEVHVGTDVEEVGFASGAVRVRLDGTAAPGARREIRARHLVGADGVRSLVARTFGAGPQNAVPIVQAKVELPEAYDPDVTRVWFHRVRSRFFYWLIPDSARTGVAGLVAEGSRDARRLLDEFLGEHGLRALDYQGAMIPLHRPGRRLEWRNGSSRVLLVGDAAAHVKVTTVGGVVSGLWGACAAANSLLYERPYWLELRALHRELYLHDLMRWFLDRFGEGEYERLLRLLNTRLVRYLGRQARDTIARAPVPLVLGQPRLWGLVLKVLVKPGREVRGAAVRVPPLAVSAGD